MPCRCIGWDIIVSLTKVSFMRSLNFRATGSASGMVCPFSVQIYLFIEPPSLTVISRSGARVSGCGVRDLRSA